MPIRAIIFDIGGVLVHAGDLSARRAWESHLGLQPGDIGRLMFGAEIEQRAVVGKATEQEVWADIGARLGVPPDQCDQFGRDFWGTWNINTELLAYLRELRPHYKTAIISNAWPGIREIHERETRLHEEVDLMVFSAEEGVAKPNPAIFTLTLDKLGVSPEETIFVDDVPENVEAANALGIHGIVFTNTQQTITDIRRLTGGEE